MYKDYFGEELKIGDYIVLIKPGCREFAVGWVIAFAKKNIILQYRLWDTCWYTAEGQYEKIELSADQLIKITREQATPKNRLF